MASLDDVSGYCMPVSMQLLDLGSILVAYKQVQHSHLRQHSIPLINSLLNVEIAAFLRPLKTLIEMYTVFLQQSVKWTPCREVV